MTSRRRRHHRSPSGWDLTAAVKRRPRRSDHALAEAEYLMTAAGPNVVPMQRLVVDAERVELHLAVASGSVADALAERGRLAEPEARAVGVAVGAALTRLHASGLVHADVKPANVLITSTGEIWLADFDAARPADDRPIKRATPGRFRRGATATPGTDVIALAVMVAEMSAGVAPDPDDEWSRSDLVRLGCPPRLAAHVASVLGAEPPPAVGVMVDRLGRGEYLVRPEPARVVRGSDPTSTLDFDPVVTHPPVRTEREARPDQWLVLLIVVVLAAVVVAAVAVGR